jgi:hypothetical protein
MTYSVKFSYNKKTSCMKMRRSVMKIRTSDGFRGIFNGEGRETEDGGRETLDGRREKGIGRLEANAGDRF